MLTPNPLTISPKTDFLSNPATASAHCDLMASPAFKNAARAALLEYQYRVCPAEPTVLAIAASKLKGAQEFLAVLMTLGLPERTVPQDASYGLVPPETTLTGPFAER